MLKYLSSTLCTSKIHPFSLGNYLGTLVWSELDAQIVKNCWRMACILPTT